jgi:DeoR/GlpR family transcriptional regulator of sugar metabolism
MEIIEAVLRTADPVRTRDLAEAFGIGQNLLANDLNYLEDLGLIVRGHGWIKRRLHDVGDVFAKTEFATQQKRAAREKETIGRYVAAQLPAGGQVVIDSGSTAVAVGEQLAELDKRLKVVTNCIPLALLIASRSSLSCDIVGGTYDREHAATTGADAARMIESQRYDAAVLTPRALSLIDSQTARAAEHPSARAIRKAIAKRADELATTADDVAEHSLYVCVYGLDSAQHAYKGTLIKSATRVFVALDSSKFAASGQCFFTAIVTAAKSREGNPPSNRPNQPDLSPRGSSLAVRTRGPVLFRRVEESATPDGFGSSIEDPVDCRDAGSIQIVTSCVDGDHPPAELVHLLRSLAKEPAYDALLGLVRRTIVVVTEDAQPLPDDWVDRFVTA